MTDFEKSKKHLKIFFIVLGILQVLSVGLTIYNNGFELLTAIFGFIYIALYITGYITASKGEKFAGTVGIIMGCVLIATILLFDILDFAVGIFLVIEAVKYNKLFKTKDQVAQGTMPTQVVPENPMAQPQQVMSEQPASPVAPVVPEQSPEQNQNNQTL